MSIIVQNEQGWFICTRKYFNSIYKSCTDQNLKKCSFQVRKELFDIKTPFLMTSAALKMAESVQENKSSKISKKKKKKCSKQKSCPIPTSYIDSIINEATKTLIELSKSFDYLDESSISSQDWFENNVAAREAAKNLPQFSLEKKTFLCFQNQCDTVVTSFQTEDYIIPACSTFYLCDVSHIVLLEDKLYDLILLDPPWENKSVKRKKGYETLKLESVMNLSIEKLCSPDCLIIVWVTNNEKQISFVREELFKKWNVGSSVIWHWAKITQKGHFIHTIDSQNKKPYENLILGRVSFGNKEKITPLKELKPHQTIVSIPSSIHSHKPPLVEILQPYLPEQPNCLEIFARYLLPGWTSIGNEVLKLQSTKIFEKMSDS